MDKAELDHREERQVADHIFCVGVAVIVPIISLKRSAQAVVMVTLLENAIPRSVINFLSFLF